MGTTGSDTIHGTRGRDVIVARAGDDTVDGRSGDDLVCGGNGSDRLAGGPGDDELHGQRDRVSHGPPTTVVGDVLRGGPGDDLLDTGHVRQPEEYPDVPDLVIFDTARQGVHVDLDRGTASGQGHDRITGDVMRVFGSAHHDVIIGASDRYNLLAGLGGNDRVVGGSKDDFLYGDNARATRVAGNDHLLGRGGDDDLNGGAGNDVTRGGSGHDLLVEWPDHPSGADRLFGGPGDDYLQDALEPRTDQVFDGGPGADHLALSTYFFSGGHRVHPSGRVLLDRTLNTFGRRQATAVPTAFETLVVPVGGWRVVGTGADERLWAPRGVDDPRHRGITVRGRGGDDNIIGTDYDDVLDGGSGFDQVCRRGGHDTVTGAEARRRQPIYLCDPR